MGNNRYINGEVPTKEKYFDPVLKKHLEKDLPVLQKSRIYTVRDMYDVNVFHLKENF